MKRLIQVDTVGRRDVQLVERKALHWVVPSFRPKRNWLLLCSRPDCRSTSLACPSVCPSVLYGLLTQKYKAQKTKIDANFPQGWSN